MGIHDEAIVFDAHCDTALRFIGSDGFELGKRHEDGHLDIPRMREGGLDAQVFAAWVDPDRPREQWVERVLSLIDAIKREAESNGEHMAVALSGQGIEEIVLGGRIACVIGVEGGHVVGEDISLMERFHDLGVRCMTLTWMNTNSLADSANGEERWGGLSELGREAVREMDRLGMVIDCAHVSEKSFFDVIQATNNPVVISHSGMRALCDIPRNVSDRELLALSENGGVVCINFYPGFLDESYFEKTDAYFKRFAAERRELAARYGGDIERAEAELEKELRELLKSIPRPNFSLVVDHIEHAVEVAGVEHVGLGSDFDGIATTPVGLEDASKLSSITDELARRGFVKEEISLILGGNLLRVFKEVCK